MKLREITENISTVAGSVATVSVPLGVISRTGGTMLSGKYTKDQYPNTPKEYQRKKRARQ